jgi:hypothetical protein
MIELAAKIEAVDSSSRPFRRFEMVPPPSADTLMSRPVILAASKLVPRLCIRGTMAREAPIPESPQKNVAARTAKAMVGVSTVASCKRKKPVTLVCYGLFGVVWLA